METASPTCAILALLLTLCFVVHAQLGFVSIDCGKPANYSSNDIRGISYSSDSSYIDTGENHQVSLSVATSTLDPKLKDLRSFPEGKRNCYTLPVTKGRSYLVRAYFLYGNYDGLVHTPQFDLYLGTNLWSKVSISNASSPEVHEIIAAAMGNSMAVCLVETGSGKPFISALELRPSVNSRGYPANSSQSLITVAMIDFGGQSEIRYPEDNYDQIWIPFLPRGTTTLSSSGRMLVNNKTYVPDEVMQTAATPIMNTSSLKFSWPVDKSRGPLYYHILKHWAELKSPVANESRIISFAENDVRRIPKLELKYLDPHSSWSSRPHSYSILEFSLSETNGSSLPPIINAMQIFEVRYLEESFTDITDVEVMLMIKARYQLRRNWIGDPCAPKNFVWDGLRCVYEVKPYRIISLDLSSSGLTGTLPTSLGDLSELQYLDLSGNNLSGDLPAFIAKLWNIKFLNIKCSGLNETVPKALQDRVDVKLLNIVAGPCLPALEPHPRKNQAVKIAITVVCSISLLLVVMGLLFWWKRYHSNQHNDIPGPREPNTFVTGTQHQSDFRLFLYEELVSMTNNFKEFLDKGGSGSVFKGHMENKTVAVKKLSMSGSSSKEFNDEVEVLKTINHKNLITLIGYCNDNTNLALVYEYMHGGSLANRLSAGEDDRNETLSWRDRVRIAFEIAQGLEYLHYGCRKLVIHRDIKSANILLTKNDEARIADFGISKTMLTQGQPSLASKIIGTPGYLDPEYMRIGTLSEKIDVYSFGVILLELITGRPPFMTNETYSLVSWVEEHSRTAGLDEIVDRRLREYNQDSISAIKELALECTSADSLLRPTMTDVVKRLKYCLEVEDAHNSHTRNDNISSEESPILTHQDVADSPSSRL